MSISRTRTLLVAAVLSAACQTLLAASPAGRGFTRMVYETHTGRTVLFGGQSATDSATKTIYELGDTWIFDGLRWRPLYTAQSPSARSSHGMAFDSGRLRTVLFGGKVGSTELGDTWIFERNEWRQLNTPEAPSKRRTPGMAYDPVNGRVVLYGGDQTVGTGRDAALIPQRDTWELQGDTWVRRSENGPAVVHPFLVYDEARKQLLMLASTADPQRSPRMYSYDSATGGWTQITPPNFMPCVDDGVAIYDPRNRTVLFTGGVCATSEVTDESWTWDGTTWTELALRLPVPDRIANPGFVFDIERNRPFMFGGTIAFSNPRNTMYTLDGLDWRELLDTSAPSPRSLHLMATDVAGNGTLVLAGFNESETYPGQMWRLQYGVWQLLPSIADTPDCFAPIGALDTDRNKLVVVCTSGDTWEYDGSAWRAFSLTTKPETRSFSSITYDPTLRKTVLYGGQSVNYTDKTWTWDGSSWTEVTRNRLPARALASMWYDPISHKTLLFGGIGRPDPDDRIERYNEMWQFNGTEGWTKLNPSTVPPTRYGAQVGVDTRTGKTVLFGGLRLDERDTGPVQLFANDTWEWDGTNWRQVQTPHTPPARENGRLAFDPSVGRLVLFGGYSGFYHSDAWSYDSEHGDWTLLTSSAPTVRRRVSR